MPTARFRGGQRTRPTGEPVQTSATLKLSKDNVILGPGRSTGQDIAVCPSSRSRSDSASESWF
jgi:hypothetical protein